MEIVRTNDMQEILQCVPIEEQLRKKEKAITKLRDFLLLVSMSLDNPDFGFWIAYEDKKIVGYLVAFISRIPGMKYLTIQRIWYEQGNKQVMVNFEKILKKWARENEIRKCAITLTRPRIKALERRWGFKVISVNMERRIY